jgi:hypothetical protein
VEDYRILVDSFGAMKPALLNGVVTDIHSWAKMDDRISPAAGSKTISQRTR